MTNNLPSESPDYSETVRVLRQFVQDAISHLSTLPGDLLNLGDDERWELVDDYFRVRKQQRLMRLWLLKRDQWLHTVPGYQTCLNKMQADPIIGPHLDHQVGTSDSAMLITADQIFSSILHCMQGDDGLCAFSDERFNGKFREWEGLFLATEIPIRTLAPLPYLVAPFPVQLNAEIVLDRLTGEEVTRCAHVGVIRRYPEQAPFLDSRLAVGIRMTKLSPKVILSEGISELSAAKDEGRFGKRPSYRSDLMVDDVLASLRLFKGTQIRAAGLASWKDAPGLDNATSYQLLTTWPYGGNLEVSKSEVEQLIQLWQLLEGEAVRHEFAIHRFNLAFERSRQDDRIVDLVIAAEALFLSDTGTKDRGELRYRFALRAAKFIEHPSYSQRDVFVVMRRAYDLRSTIVHGGQPEPKEIKLPDNESATLPMFVDRIEELMRLALRKALSLRDEGSNLRKPDYWDRLILE